VRIDFYLFRVFPAIEIGGPKAPQFADAVSDDATVPRQPLQRFRMNFDQGRRLLTVQKRLEIFK